MKLFFILALAVAGATALDSGSSALYARSTANWNNVPAIKDGLEELVELAREESPEIAIKRADSDERSLLDNFATLAAPCKLATRQTPAPYGTACDFVQINRDIIRDLIIARFDEAVPYTYRETAPWFSKTFIDEPDELDNIEPYIPRTSTPRRNPFVTNQRQSAISRDADRRVPVESYSSNIGERFPILEYESPEIDETNSYSGYPEYNEPYDEYSPDNEQYDSRDYENNLNELLTNDDLAKLAITEEDLGVLPYGFNHPRSLSSSNSFSTQSSPIELKSPSRRDSYRTPSSQSNVYDRQITVNRQNSYRTPSSQSNVYDRQIAVNRQKPFSNAYTRPGFSYASAVKTGLDDY